MRTPPIPGAKEGLLRLKELGFECVETSPFPETISPVIWTLRAEANLESPAEVGFCR
jgi:hypothetical protein